jgi:putative toxin-antitoxin system antitoxin component (TIGR02293 family)
MWISEKIIGVADIYSYGYEVFEDEARFNDWIFQSNKALGGLSPYELLDNQYGREEVRNVIGRIDYGVYS